MELSKADIFLEAVKIGNTNTVRLLLEAGADLAVSDSYSLVLASYYGHTEVAQLLLEHGAQPNTEAPIQALSVAASYGYTSVVRLLLEAGADPTADKSKALAYAEVQGYTEIVNLIKRYS